MRTSSFIFAATASIFLSAAPSSADDTKQGSGSIGVMTGVPQPNNGAVASRSSIARPMPSPEARGKPIVYNHPNRGFMLVAPPGSRFVEHEQGARVTVQSRKGYAVNVQADDANPNISTHQMFAKLEAGYLGDNKPWSAKSEQNEAIVAGLPAGVAVYEAGSTRTKVVIVRGRQTDFVFMFFAPANSYVQLHSEFEWILTGFRPADVELPDEPPVLREAETETQDTAPLRAEAAPSASPSGRPEAAAENRQVDVNVFAESGYGYRVEYPREWQLEKVSAFTNVFSGPQGTAAYDAIVSLQNVKPHGIESADAVAKAAFDDLKSTLSSQASGVDIVGEKPVTYAKGGLTLAGRQFVASYDHKGRRFRKWALVLPRPEGGVAHIWSYTAPIEQFDTFRPVAERMLNSLRIDGRQG